MGRPWDATELNQLWPGRPPVGVTQTTVGPLFSVCLSVFRGDGVGRMEPCFCASLLDAWWVWWGGEQGGRDRAPAPAPRRGCRRLPRSGHSLLCVQHTVRHTNLHTFAPRRGLARDWASPQYDSTRRRQKKARTKTTQGKKRGGHSKPYLFNRVCCPVLSNAGYGT